MEVVISVATTIAEYLVVPIGRQFGYLFCYNRNVQDFKNEVESLALAREGVQGLVDDADRKGEIILPAVRAWLTTVNEITDESKALLDTEHQVKKKCLFVPDLKLRHQRSRTAKKKTAAAEVLKREAQFPSVSYPAPPPTVASTSNEVAEAFESRRLVLKQIMESLKDDQINMIGIYGIGGVGKTTLAKEVVRQAKEDKLFDEIVMTTISQTIDLKRNQQEIAEMLGFKFEEEAISTRAGRLYKRLEAKKRILVVLDDLWERVDLEELGIPHGAKHRVDLEELGISHGGCKVVLTSRNLNVCCQMDSQKNFYIEVLSQPEALTLFWKMAGDSAKSPSLLPVADEIVKYSGGLPIAIVTIARALRNKSLTSWRDAATQLRKAMPDNKIFSTLELSYNYLQSEELKLFFLLCCLLPEDYPCISLGDLFKYGMGLELFKGLDTLEEAETRAHAWAESLKDFCLLQDGLSHYLFKMHDVVRHVARSIASKGKHIFLARTGIMKEWPQQDRSEEYTAISVKSKDILALPDGLVCPKLNTLVLECSHPSLHFPDNFFLTMENLKVLDMSGMNFLSLPPSLCHLKNLRTFCLDRCNLKDISLIGELGTLEILSFACSKVMELPKKIGNLMRLRFLDLSWCEQLSVIPPDVILGLSKLEALYMTSSFDKWEVKGLEIERRNASLDDLKHLSCLTTLEIHIPDANCLPQGFLFENLSRFKISLGIRFGRLDKFSHSKVLKLNLDMSMGTSSKGGVKVLMKKAEYLHLEEMKGLKNVLYDLDREGEGFPELRCLIIKACHELNYISNATELVLTDAFPVLEKLDLSDLPGLKEICHGRLPTVIFPELQELSLCKLPGLLEMWKDPAQHNYFHKLRVVEVGNCDGLKYLFSHSMTNDTSRLVELSVMSCKMMQIIFRNENEAAGIDKIRFPHLHSLKLENLPRLINFCSNMKGDPNIYTGESLFHKKDVFPVLEKLHISGPTNLRHVFSPSMAEGLLRLQILEVHSCEMLKSIIASREGEDRGTETIQFPQLHTLELKSLPNIMTFFQGDLDISAQQFFNEKVEFPALKRLVIKGVHNLKEMWDSQLLTNSFPKLKVMEVQSYSKVLHAIPFSLLPRLESLEELCVEDCGSVEEVVEFAGGIEEVDVMAMLSQLSRLKLRLLPKLKHIWLDKYPHETIGFQNLKSVDIFKCSSLRSLFSLSVVRGLVQLVYIKIELCATIETVIAKESGGEENHLEIIVFPRLQTLKLHKLPNLKSFYPGRSRVNWPSLEVLHIWSCTSIHAFTSIMPLPQKPEINEEISEEVPEKTHHSISKQPFLFDNKVALTNLKSLSISNMKNMQAIFNNELPDRFLCKLTHLYVWGCPKLLRVVPSNFLPSLKAVTVKGCISVEEIFEGPVGKGNVVSLSQLEKLELEELPNLSIICSANYTTECPSLISVQLKECCRIKSFSSGIINTPKLKTIKVDDEEQWNGNLNSTVQQIFLEKGARLQPAYDAYWEGDKLFEKGLYEEALSQFEAAIQVASKMLSSRSICSKCHFRCGWCFIRLGNYMHAIKEYTKALELNPTYVSALFQRAEAHEILESFEEAIADMKRVVELDPSLEQAKTAILRLEPLAAEKQEIEGAGLQPAYDAYWEGNKLFEKKLFQRALSQFEIALQVASKMPSSGGLRSKCHFRRGWCFLRLGNYKHVIKEHTKALELNPTYLTALAHRGEAHEILESFEEAIADMKKVLELDPSLEQVKTAILRLEPLVAEKQEIKEAGLGAYLEGDKLRRNMLYEEALSQFEIALQAATKMPLSEKIRSKCHLQRGWCFLHLGNLEDQIKEYTRSLELNPTNRDALLCRGLAHEQLENFEDAIADMKTVLEYEPSEERAKIAIRRLEPLALEKKKIMEPGLGPAKDAYLEGDKLRLNKLYEEALSQFDIALQVAQKMLFSEKIRSICHLKRGWCFSNLGKYEDEIKEYTQALELNPKNLYAWFGRGVAHERLEHFEDAIADMKKLLELEPSEVQAKAAILRLEPLAAQKQEMKEAGLGPANDAYLEGDKLRRNKLYEEALSQFEIVLQLAEKVPFSEKLSSDCHLQRGRCFFHLGNHEDEIKEYIISLELNPTNGYALFYRALAHEQLEDFEEAIADMNKFLDLEPSDEQANMEIHRLERLAFEKKNIKTMLRQSSVAWSQ